MLHQSLEIWWNLKSTTEPVTPDRESGVIKAELMSWELAHQFKAKNCVNKLTVNKSKAN